jgi:uncharacterized cupin superfamily protein
LSWRIVQPCLIAAAFSCLTSEIRARDLAHPCRGQGRRLPFKAGDRNAHLTRNVSSAVARYLMIGSRRPGDASFYPDDDIAWFETQDGARAVHKDGTPY